MRFNPLGIPKKARFESGLPLPHLKITASDHEATPFAIEGQRCNEGAPYPDLVEAVPRLAFDMDDVDAAIGGWPVPAAPDSPSPGVRVAFIDVAGAPVELVQVDRALRPDV